MTEKVAESSVELHELIARRWSPRAFDPDEKISDKQLRALLEAARWAPSYGNTQPARFLVGPRGSQTFDRILGVLTEANQAWAHRVSVLFLGLAVTRNEKGELPYATYGVALAAQNLVLQAVAEGLAGHQMAGFDPQAARREFSLPDDVEPVVAIAVGKPVDADILGHEALIDRERAPRRRLPLSEIALSDWNVPAF
ncbi:nitroreductase family protein [Thermocrispum municipale]|jgi:nitroreductase|uniref:nitroreductase family protein n=1 Tax=Thermocrispum municipale TaxID=37926 RepID=UPI0004050345|nr:nitroreductase family protein [Thermocrispum municipale]